MTGLKGPSSDSGIKWINESPKRAPTATEIGRKIYFRSISSRSDKAKTPIKEIALTMRTLTNVYR